MEYLVAISGARQGERLPLAGTRFRLGREPKCEIFIDDPASSRQHAEIRHEENQWYITDLNSTNGTFVNDRRVTAMPLVHGDKVSVGGTVLLFESLSPKHSTHAVRVSEDAADLTTSLRLKSSAVLDPKALSADAGAPKRLEAIYRLMTEIAGVLNVQRLAEMVLEHLFGLIAADRGFVMLFDAQNQLSQAAVRVRRERGGEGSGEINVSRSILAYAVEKGEALLSTDAAADSRFSETVTIQRDQISSVMCVPIRARDRLLGLLYLDTLGASPPFGERDLQLLVALAGPTGLALETARVQEESLDFAEYTESILRSIQSGVLVVDAEGAVSKMNEAAEMSLGFSPRQLLGRRLADHENLRGLAAIVEEARRSGEPVDSREVVVRSGVEELPLSVSAAPLTSGRGEKLGVVVNFRSLYVLKQLSARVRQAEHLALLGTLAAGVAHEIRNPLNAMQGFADLLRDRMKEDATGLEYLQVIRDEVLHIDRIVGEMLDYARQREFTVAPLDLNRLVEGVLAEYGPEAERLEVRVVRRLAPGLPQVAGHPDKLRQVLGNIVKNALQALEDGGQLTVTTALYRLEGADEPPAAPPADGPRPRRHVAVSVADTGPGIPREIQAKIFQPFFTTRATGTGLGLAICQRIVNQLGGSIGLESTPGRGTTFTVVLPATEEGAAPSPTAEAAAEKTAEVEAVETPPKAAGKP